jgi:hypothetical protein
MTLSSAETVCAVVDFNAEQTEREPNCDGDMAHIHLDPAFITSSLDTCPKADSSGRGFQRGDSIGDRSQLHIEGWSWN